MQEPESSHSMRCETKWKNVTNLNNFIGSFPQKSREAAPAWTDYPGSLFPPKYEIAIYMNKGAIFCAFIHGLKIVSLLLKGRKRDSFNC